MEDIENTKNENNNKIINNKIDEEQRIKLIKDNLKCSISSLNYINKNDIILGYPILEKRNIIKNKKELNPIPLLFSYNEFINNIGKFNRYTEYLNSINNNYYDYWIPIYIDKKHYEKNKKTILYSFTIINDGINDIKEYNFKPKYFFEIFPIILNEIIKGILYKDKYISSNYIKCFFHYILLCKKISEEFEEKFIKYINHQFNIIHKNEYKIKIPNILNFFTLLYFCNRNLQTEKLKKMWYCLYEEYLIRILMIFTDNEIIKEIWKKLNYDKYNFLVKKEMIKKMYDNKDKTIFFNDQLEKLNLYDQICDIISSDGEFKAHYGWNKNQTKFKLGEKLKKNFGNIYYVTISEKTKQKLFELIFIESNLINSVRLKDGAQFEISKKTDIKLDEEFKNINCDDIINDFSKNEENKEFIDFFILNIYKSPIENKILLLSYFLQKKIKEKGFMEELENNYGVYLDIDNIYNEIKKQLKEIKCYKELFEYIGSEFGKNMDDIDIIKESYKKAKRLGLFKNNQK